MKEEGRTGGGRADTPASWPAGQSASQQAVQWLWTSLSCPRMPRTWCQWKRGLPDYCHSPHPLTGRAAHCRSCTGVVPARPPAAPPLAPLEAGLHAPGRSAWPAPGSHCAVCLGGRCRKGGGKGKQKQCGQGRWEGRAKEQRRTVEWAGQGGGSGSGSGGAATGLGSDGLHHARSLRSTTCH